MEKSILFFSFKVYLFILRETEKVQAGEERDGESQAGSALSAQRPHVGFELTKPQYHDLSQNQESDEKSPLLIIWSKGLLPLLSLSYFTILFI